MLDSDLAELYEVITGNLNKAVKRNIKRFPEEFMFQLTKDEFENLMFQNGISIKDSLRFQNGTLENRRGKHRKYFPYVFTEQGIAMLSGVLRSDVAIKVSIQIIEAFVVMRKLISSNIQIFQRLNNIEMNQLQYQIKTDKKFEEVFNAIEDKDIKPKQGIFFDGQVFEAYKFVSNLVRSANESMILIDNYIDDTVLTLFSKRNKKVNVKYIQKT